MQTIAVIFGGRSAEHDISIVTAIAAVIKPLKLTGKYQVKPVYISKSGAWYCDEQLKDIDVFRSGKIDEFIQKSKPVQLQFKNGLQLVSPGGFRGQTIINIDIVFPAMHGTNGEDGALMGLLNLANVAYVGCDLSAASVAMDKVLAKQVAADAGVDVVPYHILRTTDLQDITQSAALVEQKLSYPLFVKPAHLGSSIGISRVTSTQELINGIEVASHYDELVLVEEEVKNLIEVTLPVIGNDELTPALLERPLTDSEDFFDFDTKYLQGGKKGGAKKSGAKGAQGYSELPAKLPSKLYEKAEATGLAAYRALGCQGIARIDMLIDSKSQTVYFNEANPLPGSLYAHNWRAAGMSSVELVTKLVDLGLARHAQKAKRTTAFTTNYLQQF